MVPIDAAIGEAVVNSHNTKVLEERRVREAQRRDDFYHHICVELYPETLRNQIGNLKKAADDLNASSNDLPDFLGKKIKEAEGLIASGKAKPVNYNGKEINGKAFFEEYNACEAALLESAAQNVSAKKEWAAYIEGLAAKMQVIYDKFPRDKEFQDAASPDNVCKYLAKQPEAAQQKYIGAVKELAQLCSVSRPRLKALEKTVLDRHDEFIRMTGLPIEGFDGWNLRRFGLQNGTQTLPVMKMDYSIGSPRYAMTKGNFDSGAVSYDPETHEERPMYTACLPKSFFEFTDVDGVSQDLRHSYTNLVASKGHLWMLANGRKLPNIGASVAQFTQTQLSK